MYYVYALIDPINRVPFYIGKGKNNRMYDHLKENDDLNKDKIKYIKNIRMLGQEPLPMKIIDGLSEEEAYSFEHDIIKYVKYETGFPITNKIGIRKPPSRKGIKWSKESIEKRSKTLIDNGTRKGVSMSNEQKDKISKANKGKKRKNALRIDKVTLYDLYVLKNMSRYEIANYYNVSLYPINRLLKEHSIKKMTTKL